MASPARATVPFWLKSLVIGMGLLIVVGFIVVVAEVGRRLSTPSDGRPPAPATSSGTPFTQRIALPSGARIVSMMPAGDRVVVHVELQGGQSAAYLVDPRSGTLLGTIEFPPAAGR